MKKKIYTSLVIQAFHCSKIHHYEFKKGMEYEADEERTEELVKLKYIKVIKVKCT